MKQNDLFIRIINDTSHEFTNVSLFSMEFQDLSPQDTTKYLALKFDSLKHDPLIYCVSEGTNYGRYVKIPEGNAGYYTYTIDSLKNKMIYVNLVKD
ncbi:hypothetical protein [Flagellimonas myxillae]|uniref:hypothetical protein n=1 Tax=Flagellimonas myxillae TaxID=2942214 RepID=UPI00201F4470|nr:hypothetical protein [Muricauda myxillae]MCL6266245.1 hypothetical protein [Muricauda myxillae]